MRLITSLEFSIPVCTLLPNDHILYCTCVSVMASQAEETFSFVNVVCGHHIYKSV